MSDHDRDPDPAPIRDTERTTVVHTEGGRGGSGLLIAIVLIIAVLAVLFLLFGGNLNRAADEGDINIAVDAPEVTLPEVNIPDVNLNIPDVDIDVDKNEPAENKT